MGGYDWNPEKGQLFSYNHSFFVLILLLDFNTN